MKFNTSSIPITIVTVRLPSIDYMGPLAEHRTVVSLHSTQGFSRVAPKFFAIQGRTIGFYRRDDAIRLFWACEV